MMRTNLHRLILCLVPIVLAGCSTYRHEFPDRSADQVWSAALAVAKSPDYHGDWHVTQNDVWVDPEVARIEIERELRRLTNEPYTRASPEKRHWQFRIEMETGDPVTLTFQNRNPTIPGWTLEEAQRYFDEVNALLIATPAAGVESDAAKMKPDVKFDEAADDSTDMDIDDSMDSEMPE